VLEHFDTIHVGLSVSLALVMLAVLLGVLRLAKGPTLADRVVALDMMTVSIVAFCAIFAISADSPVFLDVGIVLALIGFLATVALARFAERRLEQRGGDPLPSPVEQLEQVVSAHLANAETKEPPE
jgi:multicomponent Na+:H+ antiporter subunit F